jgi:hypothetical protein
MSKVREASLQATLDYVRETFGHEALRKVLDSLGDETRGALALRPGASVAPGWHPASLLAELLAQVDRTCGRGDLALVKSSGKYLASRDINRFFRWVYRLAGPSTILSRASSIWSNYNDDGACVVEQEARNRAVFRVEGWSAADPVLCKRIEGWAEGALELAVPGARTLVQEQSHLILEPAVSPQRLCRFVATWGD